MLGPRGGYSTDGTHPEGWIFQSHAPFEGRTAIGLCPAMTQVTKEVQGMLGAREAGDVVRSCRWILIGPVTKYVFHG